MEALTFSQELDEGVHSKVVSLDLQENLFFLPNVSHFHNGCVARLQIRVGAHGLDSHHYSYYEWVHGSLQDWYEQRLAEAPLPRLTTNEWHGPCLVKRPNQENPQQAYYYHGNLISKEQWLNWVCNAVSP